MIKIKPPPKNAPVLRAFQRTLGMVLPNQVIVELPCSGQIGKLSLWIRRSVFTRMHGKGRKRAHIRYV